MFSVEFFPEWLLPTMIIVPILICAIFMVVFADLHEIAVFCGLAVSGVALLIIVSIGINSPVKITSDSPVTLQSYYKEPKFGQETSVDKEAILKLLAKETKLEKIDYLDNDETIESVFNGGTVDFHGFSSDNKYVEGKFYFTKDTLEIVLLFESEQEQISLTL